MRGEPVECTATTENAEGSLHFQWRFLPEDWGVTIWNGDKEELPAVQVLDTRDSVWSGEIATSGRVMVRAADTARWAHAHVDLKVYPRVYGWYLSAGFKRGKDLPDSLILGDSLKFGSNRDVRTGSNLGWDVLQGTAEVSTIGGGPNDGYAYVADHAYEINRTWHVNTRLTKTGPKEIWDGSKLVNAWTLLVADQDTPHPTHMLAGTTGHEGTGANGGSGHQGQLNKILWRRAGGCGDAAAMAEGIVTETEDQARLLIEGDTTQSPWVLGIELCARHAFDLGMSHHYVHGNHADSSVYMYKDPSDNGYYPAFPHSDTADHEPPPDRPLHPTCDSIF